MRAVGIMEFGAPDVLRIIERSAPEPGDGEVRIRVCAAAVNPTDLLLRSGRQRATLAGLEPPYTPGMELAGIVDAIGSGVTLRVGQRVMAAVVPSRPAGGAQAELVVASAGSTVPIDAGVSFAAASTLPMGGLTALLAVRACQVDAARSVLVTGASGVVGGFSVQLARRAGLRTVAVGAEEDAAWLNALGANEVHVRSTNANEPFTASAAVDAVIDAAVLGGRPIDEVLRPDGLLVALRREADAMGRRSAVIAVREHMGGDSVALAALADLAARHELTPRIAAVMPFEEVAAAHRRLERGGVRGRIVLRFDHEEDA